MPHVVFDGWSRASLLAAAADAGFDADSATNAFPGGAADMVEHFFDLGDRRMLAELEGQEMRDLPPRQRLVLAIRTRFGQFGGDREAVRRALSVLALPANALTGLRVTYRTADAVWHGIGDEATDFSYYTKRVALAGVHSAALLFWLGDGSEDSAETWDFLDRRIGDILRLGKLREDIGRRFAYLPTPSRLFARSRGNGRGRRAEFTG